METEFGTAAEAEGSSLCRKREQRAELERMVEELRQREKFKAELEEHKKKCEDMVKQLTEIGNKENAAEEQGSKKAAEIEAEEVQIVRGGEDRQSGVKRVMLVRDSHKTSVKEELLDRVEGNGRFLQIEKRVVEANRVIRGISRRFEYGVIEVNRVVYEALSDPFTWDIRYNETTGSTVGDRVGHHIVHFSG
ncbi:hypothetical protein HPB47_013912, partial [Ixodes persulcatus]